MKVSFAQGAGARATRARVGAALGAAVTAVVTLGTLGASGCGSAPPQEVTVRWLLADGRSCIDAAVASVTIQVTDPSAGPSPLTAPCPADARRVGQLLVPGLTPGVQLHGRGLSSSSTVLYQGELRVPDPVPKALDLTLYFTGGR